MGSWLAPFRRHPRQAVMVCLGQWLSLAVWLIEPIAVVASLGGMLWLARMYEIGERSRALTGENPK